MFLRVPAESSITFDDVTVVINSCRVNVASFDPINNMPQLGPQVRKSENRPHSCNSVGNIVGLYRAAVHKSSVLSFHVGLFDPISNMPQLAHR